MTTSAQTILEFSQRLKISRELAKLGPWNVIFRMRWATIRTPKPFHDKGYKLNHDASTFCFAPEDANFIAHAANTALVQAEIIRRMAETLDCGINYFKSCGYHTVLNDEPEYQLLKDWIVTLSSCAQLIKELENKNESKS